MLGWHKKKELSSSKSTLLDGTPGRYIKRDVPPIIPSTSCTSPVLYPKCTKKNQDIITPTVGKQKSNMATSRFYENEKVYNCRNSLQSDLPANISYQCHNDNMLIEEPRPCCSFPSIDDDLPNIASIVSKENTSANNKQTCSTNIFNPYIIQEELPDWLYVYAKAPHESDNLIRWDVFRAPQLEYFNLMMTKLLKQDVAQLVIEYEQYRHALQHELERRQ